MPSWQRDEFVVCDDPNRIQAEAVHALLRDTYWAAGRTLQTIQKSLRHSINFGLFHGPRLIGFSRVITDYVTHGYLCDVVVAPDYRGRGLGGWLLECVLNHPDLATSRIDLFTKDAQDFYRKQGFAPHRFDCLVHYPAHYAGGS